MAATGPIADWLLLAEATPKADILKVTQQLAFVCRSTPASSSKSKIEAMRRGRTIDRRQAGINPAAVRRSTMIGSSFAGMSGIGG